MRKTNSGAATAPPPRTSPGGLVRVDDLRHPPENDLIYRPIDPADPEIIELARSLKKNGVLQPLTITLDNYVLSGNRRLTAARVARLPAVPCVVEPITRDDPRFLRLLREHNRQRVKTTEEMVREEVVALGAEDAHRRLAQYRQAKARPPLEAIEIEGAMRRCQISDVKRPMLEAALDVIRGHAEFWPLTLRQVHYLLLNDPPLKNSADPGSRYRNDKQSYKNLSDLLLRARLEGCLPWRAMDDPTRPIEVWDVHQGVAEYVRDELDGLLMDYYRDLQQGQPRHVEVVGEKNTVANVIRPVCSDYCVPMTLGRGYASGTPRKRMLERFTRSGRDRLVLIVVSDHDPEGEDIAHGFARSLRDDFGLGRRVSLAKAALTAQQVEELDLPPLFTAKEGSSRYDAFVEKHGDVVHELEAVPPEALQEMLRSCIEAALDVEEFHRQQEREREDAARLDRIRRSIIQAIARQDMGDA